jgi:transketolase
MPSWELFDEQDPAYQESVLPATVTKRLSVEAGTTFGWSRYVGSAGASIGVDRFGASAPGDLVMEKYGFTVETVVTKAKELLG